MSALPLDPHAVNTVIAWAQDQGLAPDPVAAASALWAGNRTRLQAVYGNHALARWPQIFAEDPPPFVRPDPLETFQTRVAYLAVTRLLYNIEQGPETIDVVTAVRALVGPGETWALCDRLVS